jgi:hypothetical protein
MLDEVLRDRHPSTAPAQRGEEAVVGHGHVADRAARELRVGPWRLAERDPTAGADRRLGSAGPTSTLAA